MTKKTKRISIIFILIILLFAGYFCNIDYLSSTEVIPEDVSVSSEKSFYFIPDRDLLAGLMIYTTRDFYLRDPKPVYLKVELAGDLVWDKKVDPMDLKTNGWNRIIFDPPLSAKGKIVKVFVASQLMEEVKSRNFLNFYIQNSADGSVKIAPKVIYKQYFKSFIKESVMMFKIKDSIFFYIWIFLIFSTFSALSYFIYRGNKT